MSGKLSLKSASKNIPSWGLRFIIILSNFRHAHAAFVSKVAVHEPKKINSVVNARTWLGMSAESSVAIFFGTSTGSTEDAAHKIANSLNEVGFHDVAGPFDIDSIKGEVRNTFAKYRSLIVGTPTWNTGAETERSGTGWDEIYYGEMQDFKLQNKKVAVFGLGDSESYSENYADGSGELHDVFKSLGCKMHGYVSQEGYLHEESKAIRGDKFCGLMLDAVNQEELTEERVKKWVVQLIGEGFLELATSEHNSPELDTPEGKPEGNAFQEFEVDSMSTETIPQHFNEQTINAVEKLQNENRELRRMLEENSSLLDETILLNGKESNDGYAPHHNPQTSQTMWTSPNGRSCYFTVDKPKSSSVLP